MHAKGMFIPADLVIDAGTGPLKTGSLLPVASLAISHG